MSDRLYLGTRKGLFTLDRMASGWEITKVDFLANEVPMLLPDSRSGGLYAALYIKHFGSKLHRSTDGGENWKECTVPVYPEGAKAGPQPPPGPDGELAELKPASLNLIWSLEAGGLANAAETTR